MRIIIAGSRDFSDYKLLCRVMDQMTRKLSEVVILSGNSGKLFYNHKAQKIILGADLLGEEWALSNGHTVKVFPPEYDRYPKKMAPLMRNQEMVDQAQGLVAFWKDRSPGTKDCIERARKRGLKVKVVEC